MSRDLGAEAGSIAEWENTYLGCMRALDYIRYDTVQSINIYYISQTLKTKT